LTKKTCNRQRLGAMLCECEEAAENDLKMLNSSSDVVIGMRIFQQFVIDLLGRNTDIAAIFRTKTEAE
jgi:hypothetical protein